MRQHVLIGAVLIGAFEAQASPRPLGDDELKTAVVGKTVKIDTPLGMPITVLYSANGLMSGEAGTALGVYLGAPKDRGRWSVRDGKLCQKWFKWLDAETTCMSIRQDGQKIFWKSDNGKTGTATIEPGPPVLAGTSAAGLGLPQPPKSSIQDRIETEPNAPSTQVAPLPAPQAQAKVQAIVTRPAPVVRPAAPKSVEAVPRPEFRRAAMMPMPNAAALAPSDVAVSDGSILPERAVAHRVEPIPVRFAFAASVPVVAVLPVSGHQVGPFADPSAHSETEPWARGMRQASVDAAHATLEHRWCLANAFSKLPSASMTLSGNSGEVDFEASAPSLLAVSLEQIYERELPIYDASCLTALPAIRLTAETSVIPD